MAQADAGMEQRLAGVNEGRDFKPKIDLKLIKSRDRPIHSIVFRPNLDIS
jgi:hypothetical protein